MLLMFMAEAILLICLFFGFQMMYINKYGHCITDVDLVSEKDEPKSSIVTEE